MVEDRRGDAYGLQPSEGFLRLVVPVKLYAHLEQGCHGGGDAIGVPNEPLIEVGESKKYGCCRLRQGLAMKQLLQY